MTERLFIAVSTLAAFSGGASAQSTDSNPAHTPSVFLGNDRPKNKKDKAPTSRSVKGKVVDASGQPLEGALVTVTNTKTNDKRTFITKQDGTYSFDDLSFTVDYQLDARYKDRVSDTRKLSQYDRTPRLVRILDIGDHSSPTAQAEKEDAQPKR